jgi:hypothetical protein
MVSLLKRNHKPYRGALEAWKYKNQSQSKRERKKNLGGDKGEVNLADHLIGVRTISKETMGLFS